MSNKYIFKLRLPVKIYLKKFLECTYGHSYVATSFDWLGIIIREVLDKEYKKPCGRSVDRISNYEIILPKSMVSRSGFAISDSKLALLDKFINQIFYFQLFTYLDLISDESPEKSIIVGVSNYCKKYNLTDEDIDKETMYRYYFRHKKKQQQNEHS